jgi:hypothetical protein
MSEDSKKKKRKRTLEKDDGIGYLWFEAQVSKLRTTSAYFDLTIHASIISDIFDVSTSN